MKKELIIGILAALMMSVGVEAWGKRKDVINKEDGSITFRVDLNLPQPEGLYYSMSGRLVMENMLRDRGYDNDNFNIITSSYADDVLCGFRSNPFFKGMIEAFAHHRPVVLSPDVIWLLISQGFAHYVNENPELMRDLIVDHDGKMSLVVETDQDLLTQEADWVSVIGGFTEQIKENTKAEIADMMQADFSTTGVNERMVSQITLMESVKTYFDYVVVYVGCGIPDITLKGTPDDWQKVLDKTMNLKKYGLGWWVDELEPILKEFVRASKGNPDREFWMDIVKRYRPGDLRGGGCSMETPTRFDGWFLKFFPFDKKGRTPAKVTAGHDMLPEMVKVDFRYLYLDRDSVTLSYYTKEYEMELWAGIVGMEQDTATYAFTPRIGWFVRMGKDEKQLIEELKNRSEEGFDGLSLRVKEVPEIFRKIDRLDRLELRFLGKVVIPEWMDNMEIKNFSIWGDMTVSEAEALRKRFQGCRIRTSNGWVFE